MVLPQDRNDVLTPEGIFYKEDKAWKNQGYFR